MNSLKTYQDPIYGDIQLDEFSDQFINHQYFQRLKNIKQLGLSYKVFNNLTHTRFEHSIGVAYLCKLAATKLELDKKLIILVTIAGLLHDIGHGPQSHLFDSYLESIFYDKKDYYEHEYRSVNIFKRIVYDNEELQLYFSEEDKQFICDMILGDVKDKLDKNRCVIELLNNKASKIDLDKLDYLNRDTYYYHFNVENLNYLGIIDSLKIINVNGLFELCYSYELKSEIDKLFERRFFNHFNIYQNVEIKAWELCCVDVLVRDKDLILSIFDTFNIDKFCQLTDDNYDVIKCDYRIFGDKFQNDNKIEISKELQGTNLLCKEYKVNYGANHENPVNRIIFYTENNSIKRINENNRVYEENYKYLCYKDNLKHDLSKYEGIYNRLVFSHTIPLIDTRL